ncbi:unnamed protein product [Leptidea sinapis]|uniref:Uncharacterized protein n=1 Tax=Leptidea sinapis TaxID=189913 RepID=A0A5E4Q6G7_9NEOP|nr:unnamed protein product [Leptidea sinapis]
MIDQNILPKRCSVGELLNAWEMSVRQACAPEPQPYRQCLFIVLSLSAYVECNRHNRIDSDAESSLEGNIISLDSLFAW